MNRLDESRDSQLKADRLLSVVCKQAIEHKILTVNPVTKLPKPQRNEVLTFGVDELLVLLSRR